MAVWEIGEACTGFWWGDLMERDNLEDPSIDGRIILKRIFMQWDVELCTGLIWLRTGAGGGQCGCDKEPLCSTKCWEFLD